MVIYEKLLRISIHFNDLSHIVSVVVINSESGFDEMSSIFWPSLLLFTFSGERYEIIFSLSGLFQAEENIHFELKKSKWRTRWETTSLFSQRSHGNSHIIKKKNVESYDCLLSETTCHLKKLFETIVCDIVCLPTNV